MEGAVAYSEATGKHNLLDVLCRYADHIEASPNDPDNPKFDRLARLLDDERSLRDLLDQYRNVLHKG